MRDVWRELFARPRKYAPPSPAHSLHEFFYELERIRDEKVSDEEIANAKSYLSGVFPIRIETQEGLIDQVVSIKMFDLPADYLRTYREHVNNVSIEDIQRVAQTVRHPRSRRDRDRWRRRRDHSTKSNPIQKRSRFTIRKEIGSRSEVDSSE